MTEYTRYKTNISFDIMFILIGFLIIFGSGYVMYTTSEGYWTLIMDLVGAGLLFTGILNLTNDLRSKPNKPEK